MIGTSKITKIKAGLIAAIVLCFTSCTYGPEVYRWEQSKTEGKKYGKVVPENEIVYSQDTNYNVKFIRKGDKMSIFVECPTGGYILINTEADNKLSGYHSDNYKEIYNDFISRLK